MRLAEAAEHAVLVVPPPWREVEFAISFPAEAEPTCSNYQPARPLVLARLSRSNRTSGLP
jgi:hypothetical protein